MLKKSELFIKLKPWLPVVSFLWGVCSGFLMTRDYKNISLFVIFSILSFLTSALFSRFFLMIPSHLFDGDGKLARFLKLFRWSGLTFTQAQVQYVFLYCIPFCFLSQAYFLLFITVILSLPVFWDPWWSEKLQSDSFRRLVRSWSLALSLSFLWPWIWPSYLQFEAKVVAYLLVISAFPFSFFIKKLRGGGALAGKHRFSFTSMIKNFYPFAPSLLWCLAFFYVVDGMPLISVWIKNGRFEQRNSDQSWSSIDVEGDLSSILEPIAASQGELCCLSPIVAPANVKIDLVHRWFYKSTGSGRGSETQKLLDTIALPSISGGNTSKGYRTYSCKKSLPMSGKIESLSCDVYLKGGGRLGTVRL